MIQSIFLFLVAFLGAAERPSLRAISLKAPDTAKVRFFSAVKSSSAFVRGEVEDPKVQNFIKSLLGDSIAKIHMSAEVGDGAAISEEVKNWFNFAADLAYEESTLEGLQFAGLIRSLVLDELEKNLNSKPKSFLNSGPWLRNLRAPWPVDRVFLFESKRMLKPSSLAIAEKVARAFQKNPYQTAEQILTKIPGGQNKDVEFLKSIWRESDLKFLKTEANRLGALKARAAQIQFEHSQKRPARNWEDLLKMGGLDKVPTDYFSGRPMDWSQLGAAPSSSK